MGCQFKGFVETYHSIDNKSGLIWIVSMEQNVGIEMDS